MNKKLYNIYYVTEGYTYTPKYNLNSVNSDGFDAKTIFDDLGFTNIIATKDYVYGIKSDALSRLR